MIKVKVNNPTLQFVITFPPGSLWPIKTEHLKSAPHFKNQKVVSCETQPLTFIFPILLKNNIFVILFSYFGWLSLGWQKHSLIMSVFSLVFVFPVLFWCSVSWLRAFCWFYLCLCRYFHLCILTFLPLCLFKPQPFPFCTRSQNCCC